MSDTGTQKMSPWLVETNPLRNRHLGKSLEELGELSAVVARCIIQGIDEIDPSSGKTNRLRLEEEIADVQAQLQGLKVVFDLDEVKIMSREWQKIKNMEQWSALLEQENLYSVSPTFEWEGSAC